MYKAFYITSLDSLGESLKYVQDNPPRQGELPRFRLLSTCAHKFPVAVYTEDNLEDPLIEGTVYRALFGYGSAYVIVKGDNSLYFVYQLSCLDNKQPPEEDIWL
jgi:hypothetical protein